MVLFDKPNVGCKRRVYTHVSILGTAPGSVRRKLAVSSPAKLKKQICRTKPHTQCMDAMGNLI